MATRPQDLSFVRSSQAADHLAAFLWDAAIAREQDASASAMSRSIIRMAKRAARELCDLHDITPDEVLVGNDYDPNLRDVRRPMGLDTEG